MLGDRRVEYTQRQRTPPYPLGITTMDSHSAFTQSPVTPASLGCTAELIQDHLVVYAPDQERAEIAAAALMDWDITILICIRSLGGRPFALING
jgi:hypothetical protein